MGIEGIDVLKDDDNPDAVPDSGLPVEGDSDKDAPEDAVTSFDEDDDPLSNVGDEVE